MGPNAELIVAIAKGGAYAICTAAIIYNFYQNNSLLTNAQKFSKPVLESLQGHFRKTAWIGLVFLLVAGVLDAGTSYVLNHRPIEINVQLQPHNFDDTVRELPELAGVEGPFLAVSVLGPRPKRHSFVEGLMRASLQSEQTLSFDINKLSMSLIKASRKNQVANQRLDRCEVYGSSEPGE